MKEKHIHSSLRLYLLRTNHPFSQTKAMEEKIANVRQKGNALIDIKKLKENVCFLINI